jgi:hypothetical protein
MGYKDGKEGRAQEGALQELTAVFFFFLLFRICWTGYWVIYYDTGRFGGGGSLLSERYACIFKLSDTARFNGAWSVTTRITVPIYLKPKQMTRPIE